MTAALREHPELQLPTQPAQRERDKLDVTLPAARRSRATCSTSTCRSSPGRYWHGGADEYLGIVTGRLRALPAARGLRAREVRPARQRQGRGARLRELDRTARAPPRARTLRVWSDGLGGGSAVTLAGRRVEWWEDALGPRPRELLAAGHRVMNAGWWPTYYVTGGPLGAVKPSMRDCLRVVGRSTASPAWR